METDIVSYLVGGVIVLITNYLYSSLAAHGLFPDSLKDVIKGPFLHQAEKTKSSDQLFDSLSALYTADKNVTSLEVLHLLKENELLSEGQYATLKKLTEQSHALLNEPGNQHNQIVENTKRTVIKSIYNSIRDTYSDDVIVTTTDILSALRLYLSPDQFEELTRLNYENTSHSK